MLVIIASHRIVVGDLVLLIVVLFRLARIMQT